MCQLIIIPFLLLIDDSIKSEDSITSPWSKQAATTEFANTILDLRFKIFFSAFLRDFSLWLDQLSANGASDTWCSPAVQLLGGH